MLVYRRCYDSAALSGFDPGTMIQLPRLSRLLALLAVLLALAALPVRPGPVLAQAPTAQKMDAEAINRDLAQIEAQLERQVQDDATLTRLRAKLEPMASEAQATLAREMPRLEVIDARLGQIGPKPDDKAPPESAEVARARAEQETLKKEVDETIRVARLLLVRIDQIQNLIADQRRALFRQATLERSSSIVSLRLWSSVAEAVPMAMANLKASLAFRARQVVNNLDGQKLAGALLLLLLALAAIIPARRLSRAWAHFKDEEAPDRARKALGALRQVVVATLLPLAFAFVLGAVLELLELSVDRFGELARHIIGALVVLVVMRALLMAVLAPYRAAWRLLPMSDATAQVLFNAGLAIVAVSIIGKIIEATNQAIAAALPFTVATRGLVALMIGASILVALDRLHRKPVPDDREEMTAAPQGGFALFATIAALMFAATLIIAALGGYVALASFLADQVIWGLAVLALLFILLVLVDEYLAKGLAGEAMGSHRLFGSSGVSPAALMQISILLSGLIKLVLYAAAFFLLLAPFGVDSGDMLGSLRAAFFGFRLGGLTISLSAIAFAFAAFIVGGFATRSMQRWLDKTYLPSTGLDVGLQNSITTIFGYIGYVASVLLAMTFLGLGLEKVTIFAGALSLGIGFGLKEIVNNFVSGLILLWERPIRVGDWIVVGDEQGKVQRINVRATQIETFDKASLIVPNSEFISGRVKNFMHANRIMRIIIPVGVGYDSDPEVVRKLLLDTALANREVLSEPAPMVLFTKLGDFSLDFELRCFCDVDAVGTTRSDLLFAIFAQLREQGIDVPFPRRTVELADMEGLGKVIAANLPPSPR